MRLNSFASFAALVTLLLPCAVFGVDGVILIDQNKALAGNVTPGDTPGFPVTISQPGSYRLDSNLTVPDVFTTAILITASNVTLDLNGFSIIGPNQCNYIKVSVTTIFSCSPGGTGGNGVGVQSHADLFSIKVSNGTIQGMGSDGVSLQGDAIIVRNVNAISNGGNGFTLTSYDLVHISDSMQTLTDSVASRNQRRGATLEAGQAMRNSFDLNFSGGLAMELGSAIDNIFRANGGNGDYQLESTGSSMQYRGNTFFTFIHALGINGLGIIGGINTGQNFCDSVVCP